MNFQEMSDAFRDANQTIHNADICICNLASLLSGRLQAAT